MPQTPILMDESRPENPFPVPETGLCEAVKEFVLAYALPALDPAAVVAGGQNLAATSPALPDYAVITVVSGEQQGSTVETFRADSPDVSQPGELCVKGLIKAGVCIDFYGADDASRQRAQRLAVLARSSVGVQFFNDRGMSVLYADDVLEKKIEDQPMPCHSVTLNLSMWVGVSADFDYFDKINLSRLHNVGVSYPM